MEKLVFKPKNVCANLIELVLDGNEVINAKVSGGCAGGSQALSHAAMTIRDIDKIVETWGHVICPNSISKRTSCAQQFCVALLIYQKMMLGLELTEEEKEQVISLTKVENEVELLNQIEERKVKQIKRNINFKK